MCPNYQHRCSQAWHLVLSQQMLKDHHKSHANSLTRSLSLCSWRCTRTCAPSPSYRRGRVTSHVTAANPARTLRVQNTAKPMFRCGELGPTASIELANVRWLNDKQRINHFLEASMGAHPAVSEIGKCVCRLGLCGTSLIVLLEQSRMSFCLHQGQPQSMPHTISPSQGRECSMRYTPGSGIPQTPLLKARGRRR